MAREIRLMQHQVDLLQWVAAGRPDGVMRGTGYKTSAAALRSRGLIRIRGRGPAWAAELTDAGRALLDRLAAPDAAGPPTVPAPPPRAPGSPSKTEQLVADVISAGGRLALSDSRMTGGVDWRQRAYAAQRHGKVPAGKRLEVSLTGGQVVIALLDGATGNELGAEAVPVPERVGRYHSTAKAFRDRPDLQEMSRAQLPRAVRIIHALAVEAERRGHSLECAGAEDVRGRPTRRGASGQLVFVVREQRVELRIWEQGCRPRGPYEASMQRWRSDRDRPLRMLGALARPEPYDAAATGQLDVALPAGFRRQSSWGDRKSWRLETRLPQLMREVEALAQEAEERQRERERQEAERQRAWEVAMRRAREQLMTEHRLAELHRQARGWADAEAIRAYVEAVEARHGPAIAEDPEAAAWLAYARQVADAGQGLPRAPAAPPETHEALARLLPPGMSTYGPGRW